MKEEVIKLALKLISLPSTRENFTAIENIIGVIKEELENFNISTFLSNNSPSLLISNTPTKVKKFKLIFNAHVDVVPGTPEQFTPKIKGKKLYGRGSYDMKGAAAAEIIAFKELANKCNFPIALQIVTDEESGGNNGTKFQIDKGIDCDFVLIGEPTNFDISFRSKGVLSVQLSTKGKSCHAALPWEGQNALAKIVDDVAMIQKNYSVPSKPLWKTTCSLSWIKTSNTFGNKVPDNAMVQFDIRFIPKDKETILKKIKHLIKKDTNLTVKMFDLPYEIEKDNYFLKVLTKSIIKVTKHTPKLIDQHFASDIRHFNDSSGKGISFGPIGNGIHSKNEWVDTESLIQYYEILKDFIINLN